MAVSPLAGKPAPKEMLIDPAKLEREYYERMPDLADPNQLVSFGTSGHRGSPLRGTFNEAHILAITQAICEYRKGRGTDGPLFMGKDTHALSGPAQRTALEVLAANGVETIIQRGRRRTRRRRSSRTPSSSTTAAARTHLADGIVVTPSHNPPEDGGFKYNPPNGGPADTDVTRWIEDRANALLARRQRRRQARAVRRGASRRATTHAGRLRPALRQRSGATSSTWTPSASAGLQARRRSARRRARALLGADQRESTASTSTSSTRRSIRPSRS